MNDIPKYVTEGLEYVTSIIHYAEKNRTPLNKEYLQFVIKDFPYDGLGFNLIFRKSAFRALEWIVRQPKVDYQSLEPYSIKNNMLYFKKMQMLYESMKEFRLYENMDRSDIVKDVPLVRDFVSVQNVPMEIKMNFHLVTGLIYDIEISNLKFDRADVHYFLKNENHFLERTDHRNAIMKVLNWVAHHPDENYKAIAPWYILDNKEYLIKMIMLRKGIEELLSGIVDKSKL